MCTDGHDTNDRLSVVDVRCTTATSLFFPQRELDPILGSSIDCAVQRRTDNQVRHCSAAQLIIKKLSRYRPEITRSIYLLGNYLKPFTFKVIPFRF